MGDDDSRLKCHSPDWFLSKIAAGLQAAAIDVQAASLRRRMSRAEIETLVSETLREELALLPPPAKPSESDYEPE